MDVAVDLALYHHSIFIVHSLEHDHSIFSRHPTFFLRQLITLG